MSDTTEKPPQVRWNAARIALIYLIVGWAWILLSDRLLFRWVMPGPEALWVSVLKGLGFIFVTAIMIYLLVRRDLLALKASQQALADRERQYRALFEEMNEGFALLQVAEEHNGGQSHDPYPEFIFLEVNSAFEKLTRRSRGEVVGRRLREIWPVVDPSWMDTLAHVVTSGEPVQFQRLAEPLQMHLAVVAYRPAPGQLAVLFMDITQRRRLEEQLAQSAKMEAIGRLAGGVAHDFNNLLAVILGYSEALLRHVDESSPLHGRIAEIDRAAQRGAALTRQLLDFARQRAVPSRRLDVNHIVTGLLDMLAGAIGQDVELRVDLAHAPPPVEADPGQMEQVIINLALNARDAMPGGGILSIRTREFLAGADSTAPPGIRPGRYVLLQVEDVGAGMDAQTRQRMYEPFFSTKKTGTGLGLSIVYGIIQQAGGAIDVQTRTGVGTRFDIYLPAADGREPPA
jgi:two-component system, cell cycle sensor histidine kinase and response regulator CckA